MQLEARAGGLARPPFAPDSILEIHKRFCDLLPEDLLRVEYLQTGERASVVPAALRNRSVRVEQHISVSPGAVPRFPDRMHPAYAGAGRTTSILAPACAHHRLLWIHPFLEGNSRVARLMSHAMLLETLNTGGLWSVARGLARNKETYKAH